MFLRPVMAPEAQWIAYGGALIAILFVLPRGIVPSLTSGDCQHQGPETLGRVERGVKERA